MFRSVFVGGTIDASQDITVWMPEFVDMVLESARTLRREARKLVILAKILEAKNRAVQALG